MRCNDGNLASFLNMAESLAAMQRKEKRDGWLNAVVGMVLVCVAMLWASGLGAWSVLIVPLLCIAGIASIQRWLVGLLISDRCEDTEELVTIASHAYADCRPGFDGVLAEYIAGVNEALGRHTRLRGLAFSLTKALGACGYLLGFFLEVEVVCAVGSAIFAAATVGELSAALDVEHAFRGISRALLAAVCSALDAEGDMAGDDSSDNGEGK